MRRYTILKSNKSIVIYDKLRKNFLSSMECEMIDWNETIAFQWALYPNKLLRKLAIPRVAIIIGNAIVTLSFIFITIHLFVNLRFYKMNPSIWDIASISLVSVLSTVLHELNHAIIASSVGGIVAEIGVQRRFFAYKTIVYFNTKKKMDICLFYSAGIVANMFLYNVGAMIFLYTRCAVFFYLAISNLVLIFFNALPISNKADGSNILFILLNRSHQ